MAGKWREGKEERKNQSPWKQEGGVGGSVAPLTPPHLFLSLRHFVLLYSGESNSVPRTFVANNPLLGVM